MKTLQVTTFFERDRAYIALLDEDERVIIEFWDEDVHQSVEDGIIEMRRLKKSLIEHAIGFGFLNNESTDWYMGF